MILSTAKFVQIAACQDADAYPAVYALDANGNVWEYYWGGDKAHPPEWRNLNTKRAELPEEFEA